jgi:hypothetical protein
MLFNSLAFLVFAAVVGNALAGGTSEELSGGISGKLRRVGAGTARY